MSDIVPSEEVRLLTASEQEMVNLTLHPAIGGLARQDLQALARRLREARDRARAIASQQRREMRGKSAPRGGAPARDDVGTVAKEQVLGDAVKRITVELRRVPAAASLPVPAGGPPTKSGGSKALLERPASRELAARPSKLRSMRTDPREVGRVSRSVMLAQARRDAKPR